MTQSRRVLYILWLVAGGIACVASCEFFIYAARSVVFPAELNIGEGVVLFQSQLIPGPGMYGDVSHYPFRIFVYPPLYFWVVHGLGWCGANLLMAGRAVSLVAAVASILILMILVRKAGPKSAAGWVACGLAGALPLSTLPVIVWVPLMRVDMLGLALSLLGLLLVLESKARPWLLGLAMMAFVAALFTRQSFVAAPMAALAVAAWQRPRQIIFPGVFGVALAAAATLLMQAATNGGFLRHIIGYLGRNGFSLRSALGQIGWWTLRYWSFWLLAYGAAIWLCARRDFRTKAKAGRGTDLRMTMLVYFLIASLMTISIGKNGSWLNYLLEWIWVAAFWCGVAISWALESIQTGAGSFWRIATVAVFILVQLANGLVSISGWNDPLLAETRLRSAQALVARLKNFADPIFSDDMIALWQAGRAQGIESFTFAESARTGILPERILVTLLEQKRFSAVVTEGGPGDTAFDSRYLPATQAALLAAYPHSEAFGQMILRTP